LLLELLVGALLGLHDEAAAAVEVDPAGAGRAVRVAEGDGVLEAVAVEGRVGFGRLGVVDAEQVAQLDDERLEVGALGGAGGGPAGDEGVNAIGRCRGDVACFHGRRAVPADGFTASRPWRAFNRKLLLNRPGGVGALLQQDREHPRDTDARQVGRPCSS
jgi:hypothetical protein